MVSSSTSFEYGLVDNLNTGDIYFKKNQVYIDYGNGAWIYGNGSPSDPFHYWFNNFINVSVLGNGISIENKYNTLIHHNSIKIGNMDFTGSGDGVFINGMSAEIYFYNNIVANFTGGYAIYDGHCERCGQQGEIQLE